MPRTYAGSVSVNRAEHVNNTLFFMAFEKEDGSLTTNEGDRGDEPWIIWLQGGLVHPCSILLEHSPTRTLLCLYPPWPLVHCFHIPTRLFTLGSVHLPRIVLHFGIDADANDPNKDPVHPACMVFFQSTVRCVTV
jgi:hypothetical protein